MKIISRPAPVKKPSVPADSAANTSLPHTKLPLDLQDQINMLKSYLEKSSDVIQRHFQVKGNPPVPALALYLEGTINTDALNRDMLQPLMLQGLSEQAGGEGLRQQMGRIVQTVLAVGQVRNVEYLDEVIHGVFDNMVVLLFDGLAEALVIDIRGGVERGIQEPVIDTTICGAKEGFVENLNVNVAMIRRKLKDPGLVVYKTMTGRRSRTDVAVLYIEDVADPAIVAEIKNRIAKIDIDGVLSSGYINQLIEDNPYSVFPQTRVCERTDLVAAELLEGRVAVMANQSPLVLIYPALFIEMFQAAEDYYERSIIGSLLRPFRFFSFILAVSLPALYIALLSYQPELVPFKLIIAVARARVDIPYPVVVEAFIQVIIIQLVIEAGLRLPTPLGSTIGVVAGIILGQAAIAGKLASPEMIIVIAVTTIATFCIPNFCMAMAARVVGVLMMIMATAFGLFGFSIGFFLIFAHLAGLSSMGVPYFGPLAPTRYSDLWDAVIRGPLWKLKNRPVSIPHQDPDRLGDMERGGSTS